MSFRKVGILPQIAIFLSPCQPALNCPLNPRKMILLFFSEVLPNCGALFQSHKNTHFHKRNLLIPSCAIYKTIFCLHVGHAFPVSKSQSGAYYFSSCLCWSPNLVEKLCLQGQSNHREDDIPEGRCQDSLLQFVINNCMYPGIDL